MLQKTAHNFLRIASAVPLIAVGAMACLPAAAMSQEVAASELMLDPTTAAPHAPATAPSAEGDATFVVTAAENKHLERQATVALARIGETLNANPPSTQMSNERALALSLFDAILHDPAAPNRPAVGAFRAMRTQQAIDDIRQTKVAGDEAVIWQIYNMGFVVRTRTVTLAFDLVELGHVPAMALDEKLLKEVVDECDVLFVSHEHLDHADHKVAQWFFDAGKPVLAPDEMWRDEPLHPKITHLPRDGSPTGHALPIGRGKPPVNVSIYPGYQNSKDGTRVENNVYVITTADGFRIAHTGDNNVPEGLPKTKDRIAPVDALVMKFEPGNLKASAIIPPFKPRLVLPAHFEELGHANVNGREPYWRGMERAAKVEFPTVLMMWGECFRYRKP